MIATSETYTSLSSNDIPATRAFYEGVLGLSVASRGDERSGEMLWITHPDGAHTLIYPKADHAAASHTVLNFMVSDLDATIADLRSRGLELENLPWTQDGVARDPEGSMPPMCWFRDPAGNWCSLAENSLAEMG